MAALPRMVTALKGSSRFLTARRAFSRGVRGLTSGPLMNLWKKLTSGIGAQGGRSCGEMLAGGLPETAVWAGISCAGKPATAARKLEPVAVMTLPAVSFFGITRHGPALDFSCLMMGTGASGMGVAGLMGSV